MIVPIVAIIAGSWRLGERYIHSQVHLSDVVMLCVAFVLLWILDRMALSAAREKEEKLARDSKDADARVKSDR
ncbi:MAG TPA: hypothetical protein VMM36_13800 [Opitutaceae bacterium]|nr:hypothetical protein [Opitutaceae bacterium]